MIINVERVSEMYSDAKKLIVMLHVLSVTSSRNGVTFVLAPLACINLDLILLVLRAFI